MSIVIRDVRERELDSVLALNNNAGLAILPLDSARVREFYEHAEYFRVAERDGNLAGFLVGFGAGQRDARFHVAEIDPDSLGKGSAAARQGKRHGNNSQRYVAQSSHLGLPRPGVPAHLYVLRR